MATQEGKKYFILNILTSAVGFLIMCFFLNKGNGSAGVATSHTDSTIVYLVDTAKHTHQTTNIFPVSSATMATPVDIDTAAIIAAFYTKHFYKQEFGDSLIEITTEDSVQCNSIDYNKTTWRFLKPYQVTKTYTTTIQLPGRDLKGIYAGAFAHLCRNQIGFGPAASYVFGKNNIGAGYDVVNKGVLVQYSFKLGK